MKRLIYKTLLLLSVIVGSSGLMAQPITTTAGAVTSCPGEIAVPVDVTNCNGIGAISLVLQFDNTKLTYVGYQNLNSALTVGMLIIHATANTVIISWANTTVANLGNSTMVQLRFNAIASTSGLTWDMLTTGNCEYTNASGTILPATFTDGTATVNQPPVISTQPVDHTTLVGQNTSFAVSATGTALVYLWQLSTNGGSSWTDLTDNATYSGVSSPTLYITNTLLTYNGFKYRCRLTGSCAPVVYTTVVTLSVINPLTTTLPTASSCPGSLTVPVTVTNFTAVAAFSLTFAFNASCLTYTGYQTVNGALSGGTFVANSKNGKVFITWSSTAAVTLPNGTLVELLFTSATGSSSLVWDVTNAGNCEYTLLNGTQIVSVFSDGNETIHALPAVSAHPENKTIAKGLGTTFTTTATGTGIGYLWQVSSNGGSVWADLANNATYTNVTTSTLSISNAQLSLSGYQYRCKVSGTCSPFVYSNPATLTVLPNIITVCSSITVCPGSIVIPVNVTDFIGVASFSLTLKFNPALLTFTGYQNLNASVSGGIFTANASGGSVYLTWSNTTAATIASGGLLFELKFTSTPGTSSFLWDTQTPGNCEYSDISGLVIFSTWTNGNVTTNQPPAITTPPGNQSIYDGGSTSFTVAASGAGLGYVWQVSSNGGSTWSALTNVSPYSGVNTPTLAINPASTGLNAYLYHCTVSGTCSPSVVSTSGQLTVSQAAITTTPGSVTNSCTGNLVIPINTTNCSNVGSISLAMAFDTTKMTFDGYQSANTALNGGMLVVNRSGNKVFLSWASTTTANIGTGVLIQYRFKANAGISTSLSWDTQTTGACEYSDPSGTIITAFYNTATISVVAGALMVNAGSDLTMEPGGSVQLSGSASGGSSPYTYTWTPSISLSNPTLPNPVASPAATTTYLLTVTGSNSCSGNDPVVVVVAYAPHTLNLLVLLEGLYSGTNTMRQAWGASGPYFSSGTADLIDVELHNSANFSQIIYTGSGIELHTNGQATVSVPGNYNASYYITVKHRNSLRTTSTNAVSFSGPSISYSFDSPSKANGNTLKMMAAGQYAVYGGDINQDGYINATDIGVAENQAANFGSGYIKEDCNGDGVVDALDLVIIDNNSSLFISAHPASPASGIQAP